MSTNGLNNLNEIDCGNYQNEVIILNKLNENEVDPKLHKEIHYHSNPFESISDKDKPLVIYSQNTLLKRNLVKDNSLYVESLIISHYSHSFSGTNTVSPDEMLK